MSGHIMVDGPYVTALADEAVPYIVVQLHAFANRDQFKQFITAGLAYYKAHSRPGQPWDWLRTGMRKPTPRACAK